MELITKHRICFLLQNILIWSISEAVIYNHQNYHHQLRQSSDMSIHKVSFTQKGYIQFLRYIAEVPPLSEYTFCIWVRSNNLTYSHPILSYSKHEEERLIRLWLSPHGTHVNLAILEEPLFQLPIQFLENHWYHVCQSWSSSQGAWNFYLNGKLKSSGISTNLKGVKIKGGGDIVVGQEYTDFDKGLDDGIEGDVFGFNFVLSSTSANKLLQHHESIALRRQSSNEINTFPYQYVTVPHHHYHSSLHNNNNNNDDDQVPTVLSYFTQDPPNRQPKGFLDIFDNMFGLFDQKRHSLPNYHQNNRRFVNEIEEYPIKSLGLRLVELSFNCYLGRGSPLAGKEVLISWTKTPVRVFGGAILKNIPPFCT